MVQVWDKDEPEAAAPAEEEGEGGSGATANGGSAEREHFDVVVSDVTDANALYVQVGCLAAGRWLDGPWPLLRLAGFQSGAGLACSAGWAFWLAPDCFSPATRGRWPRSRA